MNTPAPAPPADTTPLAYDQGMVTGTHDPLQPRARSSGWALPPPASPKLSSWHISWAHVCRHAHTPQTYFWGTSGIPKDTPVVFHGSPLPGTKLYSSKHRLLWGGACWKRHHTA